MWTSAACLTAQDYQTSQKMCPVHSHKHINKIFIIHSGVSVYFLLNIFITTHLLTTTDRNSLRCDVSSLYPVT